MVTVALIDTVIDDIIEMNEHFVDIAMGDGAAGLLVAMGTLLIVFSLGVFGLLTLGALTSLVSFE